MFSILSFIGYYYQFEGVLFLIYSGLLTITAAGTLLKQLVNVFQLQYAAKLFNGVANKPKAS